VEVPSKEMAQLQHLQKLVEEVGAAKMSQTRMITGDFEISR
jgi:hypothetical protein